VTFWGDTPLPLMMIVAPPVLPPGLGLGNGELSPSPHAIIVNKLAASVHAAPRMIGMLPEADYARQGEQRWTIVLKVHLTFSSPTPSKG
jgi:hypothetical protein